MGGCERRGTTPTSGAKRSAVEARGRERQRLPGRAGPAQEGKRGGQAGHGKRERPTGPEVRKGSREKKKFFFFLFLEFFKSIFQMDLNSCFQIWSNQSSQE